ncbi:phage portal protein family protein [Spirosoma areae]
MAKRQGKKAAAIDVIDRSIHIRSVDRSRKTLDHWKSAIISAESVVHPTRKTLYDSYADVCLDEHLRSVLDQRRLAISRTKLVFKRDGEEVDEIQELIKKRFFRQLLHHIQDARFYGYSLIGVDFVNRLTSLVPRPHVVPSKTLVVVTPYDTTGIDYSQPPYDTLYLAVGDTDDLGLLISAVPLVLLKRGDVSDWATFNELYGQPLRKGTYNPLDPAQKTQLEQALASMGSAAHVVVPEGSNVEFVESNKTGAKDTYLGLADYCDKGLSKLIVGQTMTTQDGSSKSQGEVHERVADNITYDDQDHILSYLNEQGIAMLNAQGFPVEGGAFEFVEEEAEISKKDRLTMDLDIHTKVGKLKKGFFQQEYNVEFVNDSDDEVSQAEQQQQEKAQSQEPEKPAKPGKKAKQSAPDVDEDPDGIGFAWLASKLKSFFVEAPTR